MYKVYALVVALMLVWSGNTLSFQLSPQGAAIERALANKDQRLLDKTAQWVANFGIEKFGESVHEEITNRILDCNGDAKFCSDPDWDPAFAYILAGVRWNDDPPFEFLNNQGRYPGCKSGNVIRLTTYPECWARVFSDGKKKAEKNEVINRTTAPILLRSHFGDLQFFHSMASEDKESAIETQRKILMWAELTWNIATKKMGPGDIIAQADNPVAQQVFLGHGWSVQDLFAQGNPHIRKPKYLADVAFGSLLHMVEDSFSRAHVERQLPVAGKVCGDMAEQVKAPGKIAEFHSYRNQDPESHKSDDIREAFANHLVSTSPSVVDVGRKLAEYYDKQSDWNTVRPYMNCIFDLASTTSPSSAGDRYEK